MPPKYFDPVARAAPADDDDYEDEEEEEFDLLPVMQAIESISERRRIYAMRGIHDEFVKKRTELRAALAPVMKERQELLAKYAELRRQIVCGERDITAEEVAQISKKDTAAPAPEKADKKKSVEVVTDTDAAAKAALEKAANDPAGGIPGFWLNAMSNSEVVSPIIMEHDKPALALLRDIRFRFIDENDEHKGTIVTFVFPPEGNEYFTNAELTKTYHMEFDEGMDDSTITKIEGCEINWRSPEKNLTVTIKQKKQRNKNTNKIRVVTREEKTESFFNFFSPPSMSDEDEEDEYAAEFAEQELEGDVEIFQFLTSELIPHAARYYTGRNIDAIAKELQQQYGFGQDSDEEDEEDEDEGEAPVDFKGMVGGRGGRGGRGGFGGPNNAGRGGAAGAPQQQECKQQ